MKSPGDMEALSVSALRRESELTYEREKKLDRAVKSLHTSPERAVAEWLSNWEDEDLPLKPVYEQEPPSNVRPKSAKETHTPLKSTYSRFAFRSTAKSGSSERDKLQKLPSAKPLPRTKSDASLGQRPQTVLSGSLLSNCFLPSCEPLSYFTRFKPSLGRTHLSATKRTGVRLVSFARLDMKPLSTVGRGRDKETKPRLKVVLGSGGPGERRKKRTTVIVRIRN